MRCCFSARFFYYAPFVVPTKKISIYDSNNNYINDIAGPFNEDSSLNLTCESEGGLQCHFFAEKRLINESIFLKVILCQW